MSELHGQSREQQLTPDEQAIDGLLLELARGGNGDVDDMFVGRVLKALDSAADPAQESAPREDVGLLERWRRFRRLPYCEPLLIACASLLLVAAVVFLCRSDKPTLQALISTEMSYQRLGAVKLGRYLAKTCPGSRAMLILPPGPDAVDERTDALVDGLLEGLGDDISVVVRASPPPPLDAVAPGPAPPSDHAPVAPLDRNVVLERWYTTDVFDRMVEHDAVDCDLIITTIGVPAGFARSRFCSRTDAPRLVLAGGDIAALRTALRDGRIAAAITYNPAGVYEDRPDLENLDEAFAKRFLLITPENVERIASEHPELFPSEDEPGTK